MKKLYLLLLITNIVLQACRKEDELILVEEQTLAIDELQGYVQKGPFIMGTNISVSELNGNLGQTGKTFNAVIKDDQGAFSLYALKLSSKYVELRANGFYFNEVNGKISNSQLTLSALADVSNAKSVNVNLLTHLEKNRVEYLIRTGKQSFIEAKKQAQQDILAIFNISRSNIVNSEYLDIAQAGDDNAILLAVSTILQAKRSESELTELLSKISLDLEKDGLLDNKALQSALIDEATLLDLTSVRNNIVKRYSDLGLNVTIGDFEKHINHFLITSSFTFTKKIEYPTSTAMKVNLLSDTTSRIIVPKSSGYHWYNNLTYKTTLSISAVTPLGTQVRVRIIPLEEASSSSYLSFSSGPWKYDYQFAPDELTLSGTGEIGEASVHINLVDKPMRRRIEIYENNATKPTRSRDVTFVGDNSPLSIDKIEYPVDPATSNGLNFLDSYTRNWMSGQVSMVALVPQANKVKVRISINATLAIVYANGNWNLSNHQIINNIDVYEFESTSVAGKAHNNIKVVRDARVGYMTPPRAKVEVFENNLTQPSQVKEFDWY